MGEQPDDERPLSGEVALVSGGNSGIGLGMAVGLARAGASVCIWGRRAERNEQAVASLTALGVEAHGVQCDVGSEDGIVAAFAQTVERFGRVDSCFANAGMGPGFVPFVDLELDTWRRSMQVNLDGVMLTLREAARHMVERDEGGALVAVSSTSALQGAPMNQSYSVAKTGLVGLTRGLAVELARHGIRVNALLPGWTDTDMLAMGKENEKFRNNTISRTPVRRWADPDEFGPVAAYLARRDLTFHTGDEVVVDGGYTKF
ncbi:MAG: SDR family oxidoreductase [Actinomycetia bacterium]|nr:SDR family oxidoreductase [Actinomycetes bacterium]